MVNPTRGVLYPARLPQFHRLPAPSEATGLVAWYWIPEWDIAPGRSSQQEIVAYPALNLVVDAEAVTLSGATTRASHRDLRGSGWAVGALLRPAAVSALIEDPSSLVDGERVLDHEAGDVAALRDAVVSAMGSDERHRERAVEAFSRWLEERASPIGDPARQANAVMDVLMGDDPALTPEEAATRLAVSVRTLQRMTHRYVGLSPAAMIRRRRLQEAAQRVREEPGVDLASIAAELGYADHAHLTRDFQTVLGIAPRAYRSEAIG
ncbi:AraC family transcriptional regulator [Microbacterium maritypicum]|uniref:AraC family transcriptional regulator n=1 Tax=Microbacterium maritypicum TaxID=33918 RepID=UPI001B3311A9|nr:helix-turn-helix domain-containing protein [Microbacterium liquefaciens]MBP5803787.1 AraC family transcriptional regulator [Microbacterium liquefaciens]